MRIGHCHELECGKCQRSPVFVKRFKNRILLMCLQCGHAVDLQKRKGSNGKWYLAILRGHRNVWPARAGDRDRPADEIGSCTMSSM